MSRIFLSHSSANNAEAIALSDWLRKRGWNDIFLDLDPERGLKAGERWQDALKRAAHRCELVMFLISPEWARSKWCLAEFLLAKNLNKRIFAAIVEPTPFESLPIEMSAEWQVIDLTAGQRDQRFSVPVPPGDHTAELAFAGDGLERLAIGLRQAGLDARYFPWPPEREPMRSPYRGLRPLEADDAGIFFGREAPVIEAIDRLRGLTEAAPPRLMVILGASGAGKSSFLRAGLLPRLGRDPQTFLPLPPIRPERAALSGEAGLLNALATAFEATSLKVPRGEIREAISGGAATLKPLLARLQSAAQLPAIDGGAAPKPPTLVIPIDQGEELFLAEAQVEAQPFLALLRELLLSDSPSVIAVFTIRSDNYERLQMAPELEGLHQQMLNLPPMPKGSYAEVVKGPIRRLDGTARAMKIDDKLVDEMLADIEAGGAKDALPLLAFTLERLYEEYGATGHLTFDHYVKLGRVKGSIEAAVERAFRAADNDSRIPRDREARLTLLRRGLIPWLAGIDPDTKSPRRRVARLTEIPAEARPLVDLLVEQRLLSIDVAKDTGETTIEPAHEALLRQWSLLQGWLSDDTAILSVLDGIKRAARDWASNAKSSTWLAHSSDRLRAAERLMARPDLAANLEPTDKDYVASCKRQERAERRRARRSKVVMTALAASVIGVAGMAYFKVLDPTYIEGQYNGLRNRMADASLKRGDVKRDCGSEACPEMVVLPPGEFMMGSPATEKDRDDDEGPQRKVTIANPFLVSKYEVTFAEWDACYYANGCTYQPTDEGWGRGKQPVIHVSWNDIQQYIKWLSTKTGMPYRLLTEAEWEFAARAGTTTRYYWGDAPGEGNANCIGCQSQWDSKQTAPVGSFMPNDFGLYDLHGNVLEWVQDCRDNYDYADAPHDGSAAPQTNNCSRVLRGGSWNYIAKAMRAASRSSGEPDTRYNVIGFRVARDLSPAKIK